MIEIENGYLMTEDLRRSNKYLAVYSIGGEMIIVPICDNGKDELEADY